MPCSRGLWLPGNSGKAAYLPSSTLALAIEGGSTARETPVRTMSAGGTPSAAAKLTPVGDGRRVITSSISRDSAPKRVGWRLSGAVVNPETTVAGAVSAVESLGDPISNLYRRQNALFKAIKR